MDDREEQWRKAQGVPCPKCGQETLRLSLHGCVRCQEKLTKDTEQLLGLAAKNPKTARRVKSYLKRRGV